MRRNQGTRANKFGAGEWFGELFSHMSLDDRVRCIAASKVRRKEDRPMCPFRTNELMEPQHCSKQSGICSLKLYERDQSGTVRPVQGDAGRLRCVCPHRFREAGIVDEWIGEELLGSRTPVSVAEVPFLRPETSSPGLRVSEHHEVADDETGSVGRIDNVLVHPNLTTLHWCAVEMQAVYFSGPAMSDDYLLLQAPGVTGIPFPAKTRRPDYRSSGPKRLMPQLQIKVPTLRRWGKKMAVVVDEAFFTSLGRMDDVSDVSNSDIAWFIVGFDENGRRAKIAPRYVRYTTLERAVEGLTAGLPVTLGQFETEIKNRIARTNS